MDGSAFKLSLADAHSVRKIMNKTKAKLSNLTDENTFEADLAWINELLRESQAFRRAKADRDHWPIFATGEPRRVCAAHPNSPETHWITGICEVAARLK